MTTTTAERTFLPGMGVHWLLPIYDPLTRLLGLNRVRHALIEQAELGPLHRVLDVGCGTGTLAILVKRLHPAVEVVGLDPDPKALARARRKADRAGVLVQLDSGFSDALPYAAASFDRVFSSFMFHHLERDEKERTLREIRRVLKPDGRLHLADFKGSHAHRRLQDNSESRVLTFMTEAGFTAPKIVDELALLAGHVQIVYYEARL